MYHHLRCGSAGRDETDGAAASHEHSQLFGSQIHLQRESPFTPAVCIWRQFSRKMCCRKVSAGACASALLPSLHQSPPYKQNKWKFALTTSHDSQRLRSPTSICRRRSRRDERQIWVPPGKKQQTQSPPDFSSTRSQKRAPSRLSLKIRPRFSNLFSAASTYGRLGLNNPAFVIS